MLKNASKFAAIIIYCLHSMRTDIQKQLLLNYNYANTDLCALTSSFQHSYMVPGMAYMACMKSYGCNLKNFSR